MPDAIKVFGANWCEDTQHTRQHLDQLGIGYDYIDIEQNEMARDWVVQQNGGTQQTPTLMVKGLVLSVPSNADLDQMLRESGVINPPGSS